MGRSGKHGTPIPGRTSHEPAAEATVDADPAVWWTVDDLVPWDRNPWSHPPDQVERIAASIRRNGWGRPILAHRETRTILGGHGARLAALLLFERHPEEWIRGAPAARRVPVRFVDLPWDQAVELALSDNLEADNKEETPDGLALVLREDLGGLDAVLEREVGLTDAEVRRILDVAPEPRDGENDGKGPRGGEPDLTPPDPSAVPVSVLGELYELGPHRLLCGDALEPESWARLLEGVAANGPKGSRAPGRVDAVWTDPPYAIYGSSSGVGSGVADDKMVRPFFRQLLGVLGSILPLYGAAYVACDWRSWPALFDAARRTGSAAGLEAKNVIVWRKNGGLGSNWANSYELVSYWLNMPEQHVMTSARVGGIREVLAANVLDVAKVHSSRKHHNAEKPVELVTRMLNTTENGEGTGDARPGAGRWLDTVADPFGGSGTTLIAAAETGRRAFLTELEPGYCDVIRLRWGRWARANGVDPGPGAL